MKAALSLLPPLDQPATRDVDVVRIACLLTLAYVAMSGQGRGAAEAYLDAATELAGLDPEFRARCRVQSGLVHGRSGDLASASTELLLTRQERAWFTLLERCSLQLNRGNVLLALGRAAEAAASFDEAAALAESGGFDRQQFMARHNAGFARYLTGDLPGAISAITAAQEMDVDVERAPSLLDLGRVLHEAGLVDEALNTLDRAAAQCRARQEPLVMAEIDLERARVLRLADDIPAALAAARSSRDRMRRLGAHGLAVRAQATVLDCELMLSRGLARVSRSAVELAEDAAGRGDVDVQARSLVVAAEAYTRIGEPTMARQALESYPPSELGLVLRMRHAHAAVLTDLAENKVRSARARLMRAAAELGASQAGSAALDSRAARSVLTIRLARLDLGIALNQGPIPLLTALERWRSTGQALPIVRPPDDPGLADLTQTLRMLGQRVRDEPDSPAVPAWRQEMRRLRRRLTVRGLGHAQASGDASILPGVTESIGEVAAADRDFVWFFSHGPTLHGIAVVGGRKRVVRIGEAAAVTEIVRRARADLRVAAHPELGDLRPVVERSLAESLGRLDDLLIRPWRFRSGGVVIAGGYAVNQLPWGMLPSLRGVPVTVARSLTEWAGRQGAGPANVAVLTGPQLDFADTERQAVLSVWNGSASSPGPTASSADLVAALHEAEVVHVAAHGQHQPSSPLFSSLRMSDGDVYAHELPVTGVSAGHVVLSACEAGTAEVRPGGESLGLASTLVALGVRCVVAAVAPIRDDAAASVMARYHSSLAAGRPSDVALAEATATEAGPFVAMGSTWRLAG